MPMHCSANAGQRRRLRVLRPQGTGKTTLSSDASRTLIGDDEHGWSPNGIFNFEGGCYAKTINLSREAEPEIFATTQRFGSVLENVVVDAETRVPDFDDGSLTENTRAPTRCTYIPNASAPAWRRASEERRHADLRCLRRDAAHRAADNPASGHVSLPVRLHRQGGRHGKGRDGAQPTFSTCFGAPFMPRHPSVYGNLLRKLIAEHGATCWLVNTGWTGGAYGEGTACRSRRRGRC
jgi:phosphoenolpyruvate carboxykinase (ATP)